MKQLVIIGASGHGKVVADIARLNGYTDISFLDDDENITECGGYKVVGPSCDYIKYNCDLFVAIGNSKIREEFQNKLAASRKCVPTLIHPSSVIAENVSIGSGSVIVAGAIINPCVKIGKGSIINTSASIDHDCQLGDYVHISVGSHLAGSVIVGNHTWVGIGASIINNLNICDDCFIGAGATVVKSIKTAGTYIGIPARQLYK